MKKKMTNNKLFGFKLFPVFLMLIGLLFANSAKAQFDETTEFVVTKDLIHTAECAKVFKVAILLEETDFTDYMERLRIELDIPGEGDERLFSVDFDNIFDRWDVSGGDPISYGTIIPYGGSNLRDCIVEDYNGTGNTWFVFYFRPNFAYVNKDINVNIDITDYNVLR